MAVHKDQCAERLILSCRVELPVNSKMREKASNLMVTKLFGVALVMKTNELANPIRVSSLCSQAVVPSPHLTANLFEERGAWHIRQPSMLYVYPATGSNGRKVYYQVL